MDYEEIDRLQMAVGNYEEKIKPDYGWFGFLKGKPEPNDEQKLIALGKKSLENARKGYRLGPMEIAQLKQLEKKLNTAGSKYGKQKKAKEIKETQVFQELQSDVVSCEKDLVELKRVADAKKESCDLLMEQKNLSKEKVDLLKDRHYGEIKASGEVEDLVQLIRKVGIGEEEGPYVPGDLGYMVGNQYTYWGVYRLNGDKTVFEITERTKTQPDILNELGVLDMKPNEDNLIRRIKEREWAEDIFGFMGFASGNRGEGMHNPRGPQAFNTGKNNQKDGNQQGGNQQGGNQQGGNQQGGRLPNRYSQNEIDEINGRFNEWKQSSPDYDLTTFKSNDKPNFNTNVKDLVVFKLKPGKQDSGLDKKVYWLLGGKPAPEYGKGKGKGKRRPKAGKGKGGNYNNPN
jgi:hypothetical protein